MFKKIKKSVAIAAALLLMSSNVSYALQLSNCEEIAVNLHNDLIEAGVPHGVAYEVSGLVQEICENAQQ